MKKKPIILVILLLAVGFAAVSTTLFINGTIEINANKDDFNVYYSDAYVNSIQDKSVIISETVIEFNTILNDLDQEYILDYEVTNGSKNYDAELVMECTGGNEYLSLTNEFDDETILEAKKKRIGKLSLELIKSYTGEDMEVDIKCTISANAVERDTAGVESRNPITVDAVDTNNTDLNASAYEITGSEKDDLLDSLVETGMIESSDEVAALIEVESDSFEDVATTTFDVSSIANEGDSVVILHFDEEQQKWEYIGEEIVDAEGKVIADFTSYSPVAFVVKKSDGTLDKIYKTYEIGEVITINNENFYVMSQTADKVTMLTEYNLSTSYRQNATANKVIYTHAYWPVYDTPTDLDVSLTGSVATLYINNYVAYLKEQTGDTTITGDLVSLQDLKKLGCEIPEDYITYLQTCDASEYKDWIILKDSIYWLKSSRTGSKGILYRINNKGVISYEEVANHVGSIRPTITISKSALN